MRLPPTRVQTTLLPPVQHILPNGEAVQKLRAAAGHLGIAPARSLQPDGRHPCGDSGTGLHAMPEPGRMRQVGGQPMRAPVLGEVEGGVEGRRVGEDVRVEEAEQRIQLVQVVLQRRARQQQRVLAPARTPAASQVHMPRQAPAIVPHACYLPPRAQSSNARLSWEADLR